MARAEANGQKLVLTLGDGVSYCNETDGASAGAGSHKTAAWYAGGFRTNYLPWVRTVVTRYRNSPAIAFWEILNEPGGTSDQAMRAFFDETAAAIKAIDPNHLVSSGAQAAYVNGTNDYAYVHGGPNVDIGSTWISALYTSTTTITITPAPSFRIG